MANNKGKAFEARFAQDWKKCFPNTFLFRLHDLTTGYKVTSAQPCDYLAYNHNQLFMLECKSHEGNTIPFTAIPQYERLLNYKDLEGVNPFIIIWFMDHNTIVAVPIKEAEKMIKDGKKSVNIKMLLEKTYNIIEIPSVKKRTFLESDYTVLLQVKD